MRIYLEPDDQTLKEINQAAKETGIGKAQFLLEAVDHYLHADDQGEIANIRKDLVNAREDLDQRWSEISTLRAKITSLEAELEKVRSSLDKAMIAKEDLQKAADQARGEAEALRHDQEHYKDTISQKDKHIAFLEATIHQTIEKITPALPPSQEEAKRKGWWQFWK